MFQKLNSMFLGDVGSVLDQKPELSEKEDDEWIVVDFIVNKCTKTPEEASTFEEIDYATEEPILNYAPGAFEQFEDISHSYYVHFDPCPLEESWFVTPPPCFTAGELTSIEVETSPLENLLIEHPSMSVYAVNNLCSKQTRTCDSNIHNSSSSRLDPGHTSVTPHVHCYVATLAARTTRLDPIKKTIQFSKLSKQQMEKTLLNRKSLKRQNRIRGCHSRQVKHNRVIVHQPCQRHYNY
ncbi:tumor protein p53-inducible nuclear protein 1 [Hyla sarda]|uniref:tumor protein p53-inducible nuclear protein 1 n=1 Tax=Hyla sarda TaxID=327740 RepID=UPI0024C290C4|nr:tumor protein p53-inducible nuclear protein 1 [Hyla sarda]XP_056378450.1 tumor protein p53-inducible nuclear protein 1 [Hyla sarda]XP_056378451.1 tumor protein p53-inducible nuclear protein 1 [Hyla sarda]XP_056378453.1 tumor protein p53-inducible nuclear protein 1 [Hyla sarda]